VESPPAPSHAPSAAPSAAPPEAPPDTPPARRGIRRDVLIGLAVGAVLFAAMSASHFLGSRRTPEDQPALARLDGDLSPLVERFNAARDSTRLVVLLSPT
jgi:hypothetical protein